MNAPLSQNFVAQPTRTTCPYCGVGCGVLATPDGKGGAAIAGDKDHPANFGRLCSKGSALGETLSLDARLLHPMIRNAGGSLQRVNWMTALDRVADGFRRTIDKHGPDAVAFYVSGQLLTEDYYVANKLMKGFIGSGNIDTNSRLCMASSVAGHKRAFGADTVPGCYDDLDHADLLVLTGSNAAWCHPILFQRMVANRKKRSARIVVIDPRATPTADEADLVLQIAPGTDSILFMGLLAHLAQTGKVDESFVAAHTNGFAEALQRAWDIAPHIDAVAYRCGLAATDVAKFYDWFAETEKTVTLYSQGVNQSAQGTDKVNAIINCHLATGRIGREGLGPFSLTGQPNAMGGREAGGLANQLAAHMGFDDASIARVSRFWKAPNITRREGLKAVDLFDAVAGGRVKALWVMGTNPAASMPRADAVRDALRKLDLFVVSEVVDRNDTLGADPHVVLPASAWGEKDGTVTNSERRISRQRAFLAPPGDVKPDWWIVAEVGKRLGFASAFDYGSAADVFREYAQLTTYDNGGRRDLDLGAAAEMSRQEYETFAPFQWPWLSKVDAPRQRIFADGRFFTADGRANFVAVAEPALASSPDKSYPLLLNTGRVRDQWHTMTRTGKSPRLGAHIEEPFAEIHPDDAAVHGIKEGHLVELRSAHGSATVRARLRPSQRRGEVFSPIHWTGETSSSARIGALVKSAYDPFSGQPELKATPIALAPVAAVAEGFVLARNRVQFPDWVWWARTSVEGGFGYRLAANAGASEWASLASVLGDLDHLIAYVDQARGIYRVARLRDGMLEACMFLGSATTSVPEWEWLKSQLASSKLTDASRRALLSGRAPGAAASEGPIVCACFQVGFTAIKDAIVKGVARSAEEIGACLKAGTNCGSCLPELKRIVASHPANVVPIKTPVA